MKNDYDSGADKAKESKPTFQEKNTIWPLPEAAKSAPSLDMTLFGPDALGSEIATTPMYAKKANANVVDKGVFTHKDNMISPDGSY